MASLTLDWLHLIVLLGALQGVFLTVALTTKRRNRTANLLLATAMLAFSIHMATSVYHASGLEQVYPHLFGLAYPMPFLYGPLIYLYARAASNRRYRLGRRDALHFVPFLATVLAGLPIYLMSGTGKIAMHQRLLDGDPPLLVVIADPLKFVSGIAYAVVTMGFLRRHREKVKDSYSSTERVNLRWLFWLGVAAAGIWGLATAFTVLESTGIAPIKHGDDFVSLAMATLVCGIGYMGLRQPEVFQFESAESPAPSIKVSDTPHRDVKPDTHVAESEAARYERSGLSEAEARRLKDTLLAAMSKDQPWKNSDLTLADLATLLGTTAHKLSEVLNSQIGETFYDFVNGYRVREVQRRITAGEARTVTILSLALEAGFASKSTFNQVFKKHTSQTPSDFRQTAGA